MFKTEYDNVVVISFGCEDDFRNLENLAKRYPKLYHIVLTEDPTSKELAYLKAICPQFAHEIIDLNDVQETGTGKIPSIEGTITENTKIFIRGHGNPGQDYITSSDGEKVSMKELAELLKHNTRAEKLRITLLACLAGKGNAVNSIEGSTAQKLFNELKKQELHTTISASTTRITVTNEYITRSDRVLDSTFDENGYFTKYKETLTQDINNIPKASRKTIKALLKYDIYFFRTSNFVGNAIGSKIIIREDGSVEYPYGQFDSEAIFSAEDQREKYLYAYHEISAAYRDEARKICLEYLANMAAEYPELQSYEGFQRLKGLIKYHPYPYAEHLSNVINSYCEQTKEGKILRGRFRVNEDADVEPEEEKRRKNLLSQGLNQFKTNINADQQLTQILEEHLEFAKDMHKQHEALTPQKRKRFGNEARTNKNNTGKFFLTAVGAGSLGVLGVTLSLVFAPFIVAAGVGIVLTRGVIHFAVRGTLTAKDYVHAKIELNKLKKQSMLTIESQENSTGDMLQKMQCHSMVREKPSVKNEETLADTNPKQTGNVVGGLVRRGLYAKPSEQHKQEMQRPKSFSRAAACRGS